MASNLTKVYKDNNNNNYNYTVQPNKLRQRKPFEETECIKWNTFRVFINNVFNLKCNLKSPQKKNEVNEVNEV